LLAAILDAGSRKVVGYAICRQIDSPLTIAALRVASDTRWPAARNRAYHSNRGSQYACQAPVHGGADVGEGTPAPPFSPTYTIR